MVKTDSLYFEIYLKQNIKIQPNEPAGNISREFIAENFRLVAVHN